MPLWFMRLARHAGALAATVILGGILTAALVRNSPGFDADERLMDPRLDAQSRALIQAQHAADHNVPQFYIRHVSAMLRGDWGVSQSLNTPIRELVQSRLPVTAEIMVIGLVGGWVMAFVLALLAVRCAAWSRIAGGLSVVVLSVPSAALAVLIFTTRGPIRAIIALILFPRLFDFFRNLLADAYARPHIVTAMAKGLGPARILLRHVLPVCAPQLLALAGVSASMAFGAAIPVETLCDLPGIGQLAWKAALARDLPVLVTLTMLITLLTQVCNTVSDWAASGLRGARA
jgi:peptide/nickel transport system permease protein